MSKIKPYPAIIAPTKEGFDLYFPDLPGTASGGKNYEEALKMGKECLSLHLYGMLTDGDKIPKPSRVSDIRGKLKKGYLIALIEPDVFAVKMSQESDKTVHVDITIPKNLLKTADRRAKELGLNRSKLFQKALKEVL